MYDHYEDEIPMVPTLRESDTEQHQPVSKPKGSPASTNTTLSLGEYQSRLEPVPEKELVWAEKGILIKIRKLSNSRGCTSSNNQLSAYTGMSTRSISRYISNLTKKGYLNVKFPTSRNRTIFCSSKIN